MTVVQSDTVATPELSDEEIVARVLGSDRNAFGLLVGRYNQRLYRVARSILRDKVEAEDALQQAYVQAYMHLGQFKGLSQLSTWLTRIVIREATARAKSQRRRYELADSTETDIADHSTSPFAQVERRQAAVKLETAIDSLSDIYRTVFMMRDVQGLSVSDTAEGLELTEETVKVRLYRARAQLRDKLTADFGVAGADAFTFLGSDCVNMTQRVLAAIEKLENQR